MVPLKRPKKSADAEDGEEDAEDNKENTQELEEAARKQEEEEEGNTEGLEEIEIEDRAHCISTVGESYKIWAIHQAATRWMRRDIAKELKKTCNELASLDGDDLTAAIEEEGIEIENKFIAMFQEGGCKAHELGRAVPVFNFEIN